MLWAHAGPDRIFTPTKEILQTHIWLHFMILICCSWTQRPPDAPVEVVLKCFAGFLSWGAAAALKLLWELWGKFQSSPPSFAHKPHMSAALSSKSSLHHHCIHNQMQDQDQHTHTRTFKPALFLTCLKSSPACWHPIVKKKRREKKGKKKRSLAAKRDT